MNACPVPPGPHPVALAGRLLAARGDPLAPLLQLGREYPELAALRLGGRLFVAGFGPRTHRAMLVDQEAAFPRYHRPSARRLFPDDLERLDGAPHREARRQLAPLYTRARLDSVADDLGAMIDGEAQTWPTDRPVDLAERLRRLVPRLIVHALLGVDPGETIVPVIQRIRRRTSTPLAFLREACPIDLPWSAYSRRREALSRLKELVDAAADVAAARPGASALGDQVRTHATVSLAGGAGVTAAVATWAFYLLARHPAALGRLVSELGRPSAGQVQRAEEISALPWLDQVVKETLRLYGNIVVLPRVASESVEVAGYSVPRGTHVALSPFVLHRRADLYAQSEAFRPDRFSPEVRAPDPFTYLPFGAGPHNCLGQGLAVLLLKLLLARILGRFRVELDSESPLSRRSIVTQEIRLRLPVRLSARAAAHQV